MRVSLALLAIGLAGLAPACSSAHAAIQSVTIPAAQFRRGDVRQGKDPYGSFLVVNSVVEYELVVDGVEQAALEIMAGGDKPLEVWLNGRLFDQAALALSRARLGLNEVPRWIPVARAVEVAPRAKRLSLVLRGKGVEDHNFPDRRIYELRFTTTKGSVAARPGSAQRGSWDHLAWLLERHPLAHTIQESPLLRPRQAFRFDPSIPEHPTDYPDAISSDELGYLAGNQFFRHGALGRNRLGTSLGRFVFGPAPTPEAEQEKAAAQSDLTGEIGAIRLQSADGKPIELRGTKLHFQPNRVSLVLQGRGVQIAVDAAIDFSDLLERTYTLRAEQPVALSVCDTFNLPGKWWQQSDVWMAQTVFHYLLGLDVSCDLPQKLIPQEKPLGCRIELPPSTQARLVVRLRPGYRAEDVRGALIAARTSPLSVAERARRDFRDFFARILPPLSCSDRRLVDLYHYIAYAVRLNVVDIPFQPYDHPYLTYSKVYFGGIHMWSENVATDALMLRWLNDKSLGQRMLLKCLDRPSCPPLQPASPPAENNTFGIDREVLTVYEFAKCVSDRPFLERMERVVRAHAERAVPHPLEGGTLGAIDGMLPQYDFSLRYKPYTAGRVYPGSRMNQPLAHIDANAWRCQVLRMAAAHARAAGDPAAARWQQRAQLVCQSINRLMWDERLGFYFDYATADRKRSDVMSVAAFSTLWAGVPDRQQARRLVTHLTDPKQFWPRFVVPATSLADPRTNPRGYTDGGILLDVNNWFPFQGLLRAGYRDVAVELFWRTIDLLTAHGMASWAGDNFTADDGTPMSAVGPDSGVVVDMILRCGTGFLPRSDDLFEFDPLILGPRLKSLDWGPYLYKKHWVEVHWRAGPQDSRYPAGLTILIDTARFRAAQPGHVLLRLNRQSLEPVPLVRDPLEISSDLAGHGPLSHSTSPAPCDGVAGAIP